MAGLVVAGLGPGAGFAVQAAVLAAAAGSLRAGVAQMTEVTKVARVVGRRGAKGAGVARHRGALRAGWAEFARIRWLWLLTGQWLVFSMLTLAPVTVLGPALAQRYLGGAGRGASPGAGRAAGRGGRRGGGHRAGHGVQTVFFATAVQASVRPDVLARVAAIDLVGSEGGQPVGYALAGPLAAAVGAHAFLTGSAVVMAVAGVAFTLVPALRADVSAGPQGERPE